MDGLQRRAFAGGPGGKAPGGFQGGALTLPRPDHLPLLAVLVALLLWAGPCFGAAAPAALARGVNITGWFRYPASRDPAALRAWLSDAAMADLKSAGFTFARLAIDPAIIDGTSLRQVLIEQIRRLQRHGLAVVVSPHPVGWRLDTSPADRDKFTEFWAELAPALRSLPPALTFPEVLNEPVFHENPALWAHWQRDLHAAIRAALPEDTIILTGNDWGSIAGLLALEPETDRNVIYSFHFYDPSELTTLAAWRPGLDRAALAQLPFPETDPAACRGIAGATHDPPTKDMILFWCATNWDTAHVRANLQLAVTWAARHDVALLAGEFGASVALNPAARLAWLRLVRETCAENGIGWALWGYDDIMGFNVRRPPETKPRLDRSVLAALGLSVS
jgi:endoglucanase